jgi:hypothetical protein
MVQNHSSNRETLLKGNTGPGSRNKPSIRTIANQLSQSHRYLPKDNGKDWETTGGTGDHKPLALNSLGEIQTPWIPQQAKPPLRNRK